MNLDSYPVTIVNISRAFETNENIVFDFISNILKSLPTILSATGALPTTFFIMGYLEKLPIVMVFSPTIFTTEEEKQNAEAIARSLAERISAFGVLFLDGISSGDSKIVVTLEHKFISSCAWVADLVKDPSGTFEKTDDIPDKFLGILPIPPTTSLN